MMNIVMHDFCLQVKENEKPGATKVYNICIAKSFKKEPETLEQNQITAPL